jgi:hypothetical protein
MPPRAPDSLQRRQDRFAFKLEDPSRDELAFWTAWVRATYVMGFIGACAATALVIYSVGAN